MFKKIAQTSLSQVLAKIFTAIISIVLLKILTSYLPEHIFGIYNKVYNYLGIFAFLADLGLYTITIREISANPEKSEKILGNVLTLRAIMGVIIMVIATGISMYLPGYDSDLMFFSIIIISIFTFFSLINSALLAYMQSQLKMGFSVVSVVTGKILTLAGIIYLIFFAPQSSMGDYSFILLGIFGFGLLGITVNTVMNFIYVRKDIPVRFEFDRSYIYHIFKISLPYGLALFLSVVYFKIDIFLLGILEPGTAGEVSIAYYSQPMKIVEVLMVFGGFYLNSLLPSLKSDVDNNNNAILQNKLNFSFLLLFLFGVFIWCSFMLFGEAVIHVISGDRYITSDLQHYSSLDAVKIVFAVPLFYFLSLLFHYFLIARGEQSILLKINSVIVLINIIGNIIFIPKYSFMGAAYITLISQFILLILSMYVVYNKMKFRLPMIELLKITLISIAVFMSFYVLLGKNDIGYIYQILIIGPIFFIIYWSINGLLLGKYYKNHKIF